MTPTDATSRSGPTPKARPAANEAAAKQKYTPRNSQP